jgi:hypothetical protein
MLFRNGRPGQRGIAKICRGIKCRLKRAIPRLHVRRYRHSETNSCGTVDCIDEYDTLKSVDQVPNAGNTPKPWINRQRRPTSEPFSLNDSLPGETSWFQNGDAKYTQHKQNEKEKLFSNLICSAPSISESSIISAHSWMCSSVLRCSLSSSVTLSTPVRSCDARTHLVDAAMGLDTTFGSSRMRPISE